MAVVKVADREIGMNWVKIEDGCMYPNPGELVAVKISFSGIPQGSYFCRFIDNDLFGTPVDLPHIIKGPGMVTEWARLHLSNN